MRRRAALALALRAGAVAGGARVAEHAPPAPRQLERQRVGVRVAGNVVRPDRRDVGQHDEVAGGQAQVAAGLEPGEAVDARGRLGRLDAEALRQRPQHCGARRDAERRVVEERDVAVGMGHDLEPAEHGGDRRPPALDRRLGEQAGKAPRQRHEVEQVLDHDRVVHRAALEVPAVGEHLLGELLLDDPQAGVSPACRLVAVEERAGEHQRLAVGPEVVAEQVHLQPLHEPAGLHGEALHRGLGQRVARQRPARPVHDAQRDGVGLPAVAVARRVLGDPARHQRPVPGLARVAARGVQVVEVVQVVEPELVDGGVVPAGGGFDLARRRSGTRSGTVPAGWGGGSAAAARRARAHGRAGQGARSGRGRCSRCARRP